MFTKGPCKPEDIECEEFYNLMQAYRYTPFDNQDSVIARYEAVKAYIAKLINKTAAPDLYEACKAASVKLDIIAAKLGRFTSSVDGTETRETRALLEKALAKANGKADQAIWYGLINELPFRTIGSP